MKKLIIALLAGAALGALFAPDKGSKTRKKLRHDSKKITDDLLDDLDRGLEAVNDWTEKVVKTVKETADTLNLKR
jgi:gas vesicle protein